MKRVWVATGILLVIFGATLANSYYLKAFTQELTTKLTQAEASAETGDWDTSKRLTDEAYNTWFASDAYLHVTLRHADIDTILIGFREVNEFITCEEGGEYSAANARLITEVGLLYEAEALTLKNIF